MFASMECKLIWLALRGAKRHSDYLIDRARQQFPARTVDAKVKALNFLLPHIRRMPNRIQRDEFAADAAQKLGIDSALMRQELKQAAAARLESVPQHRQEPISETERVLLRALVLPDSDSARRMASEQLAMHPEWFADLAMADVLESLSQGPAPDNPLDAATTNEARAQMAMVLQHSVDEKETGAGAAGGGCASCARTATAGAETAGVADADCGGGSSRG